MLHGVSFRFHEGFPRVSLILLFHSSANLIKADADAAAAAAFNASWDCVINI